MYNETRFLVRGFNVDSAAAVDVNVSPVISVEANQDVISLIGIE